jgi:hypothetical protein
MAALRHPPVRRLRLRRHRLVFAGLALPAPSTTPSPICRRTRASTDLLALAAATCGLDRDDAEQARPVMTAGRGQRRPRHADAVHMHEPGLPAQAPRSSSIAQLWRGVQLHISAAIPPTPPRRCSTVRIRVGASPSQSAPRRQPADHLTSAGGGRCARPSRDIAVDVTVRGHRRPPGHPGGAARRGRRRRGPGVDEDSDVVLSVIALRGCRRARQAGRSR